MSDRWTKEEEEYLDFIQQKEAKRRERLKKNTHKKLVRDLIPGIIAEEGGQVRMCTEIKGDSKIPYYFEKVKEELAELEEAWKNHLMAENHSSKCSTFDEVSVEAADLKESINGLFEILQYNFEQQSGYDFTYKVSDYVDSEMIKKRVAKGGFAKGFIMEFDIEEEN